MKNEKFNKLDGVALTYANGPTCERTGEDSQFTINMYCDPDMSLLDLPDLSTGVIGGLCSPQFDIVHKAACPNLVVDEIWLYFHKYKYYIGAVLLLTGLCFIFAGRTLIKPAVCFVSFLLMISISCFLFYTIVLDKTNLSTFWTYVGVGALVGVLFGLLMAWFTRLGTALLAGYGGASIALMFYSAFMYQAGLYWLLWLTLSIFSLAFAIIVFKYFD